MHDARGVPADADDRALERVELLLPRGRLRQLQELVIFFSKAHHERYGIEDAVVYLLDQIVGAPGTPLDPARLEPAPAYCVTESYADGAIVVDRARDLERATRIARERADACRRRGDGPCLVSVLGPGGFVKEIQVRKGARRAGRVSSSGAA